MDGQKCSITLRGSSPSKQGRGLPFGVPRTTGRPTLPYKFGTEQTPRTRRYTLPALARSAIATAPKRRPEAPLPSSVRGTPSGEIAALDRLREQRRERSTRAAQTFNVSAPARNYKTLATVNYRVADSQRMPGLFGDIRLRIDRDSVDLNRVQSGILNLCIDHDVSRPAGRCISSSISGSVLYAVCEIADVPDGDNLLRDLDAGLRLGCSPGFIIHDLNVREDGDNLLTEIKKFEPYEYSSTSVPRGKQARLIGRMSMNGTVLETGQELVNTFDLDQLSLVAGRLALESGQITDSNKRRKLQVFFERFDFLTASGTPRDSAVGQAKEFAGIA